MAEIILPIPPVSPSRVDQMFPTLTPAQLERIVTRGRMGAVGEGSIAVAFVHKALRK
jgi:hypothetical protein